jgi:5-methylcytosine-specific restriction endonuclease McrA
MSRSTPWMKFYPADWRSDPSLRAVSYCARGLWIECIALMHEAEPYGHLTFNGKPMPAELLARMTAGTTEDVEKLLAELENAGVFSRSRAGVIYSRRMVRDRKRADVSRQNGKLGGDKDLRHVATVDEDRQIKRLNRKDNPTKVNAVWEACGGVCSVCSVQMEFNHRNQPNAFEIDHIVPITQGGGNELENLRGVCKSCNLKEAKRLGNVVRFQAAGYPAANPAANPTPNTQKPEARIQSQKEEREGARATRWAAGRVVDDAWIAEVPGILERAGLPPVNGKLEAQKFADYWLAASGPTAMKADWHAAWRTWVRKAGEFAPSTSRSGGMNGQPAKKPYQNPRPKDLKPYTTPPEHMH